MSFSSRFRAAWAPRSRSETRRLARRRRVARPLFEPLEDRTLLTSSAWQNLATALSPATNNPLTAALGAAENSLNSVYYSVSGVPRSLSLPFFNGANEVGKLVTNVLNGNPLTTISTDLQTLTTHYPTLTDQQVATTLYNSLYPSILGDTGNGQWNTQNTAQDYVVITHPDGSQSVEIELYLTTSITLSPQMLDSGSFFELPGLPVQLTGKVGITFTLSFNYELAFGYDTSFPKNQNGFFIDTSKLLNHFGKTDSTGTPLPAHQMSIIASASLAPGSNIGASLGWFQARLSDNTSNPTKATLTLNVDGLDLNPVNDVKTTWDGNIGIHLTATAGLGPYINVAPGVNEFEYLSVGLDLDVDWTFSSSGQDTGPTVSYGDIQLMLGPAIGQFVTPIVQDIQTVLLPLEPILTVLTTPIPGLSDLSNLDHQGNVTLLTLIEDASNLGVFGLGYSQLVDLAAYIVTASEDIEQLGTTNDTLSLDVGDLTLPDSDTDDLEDSSYVQGNITSSPLSFDPASTNPVIQNMQDVITDVNTEATKLDVVGLSQTEQQGLQMLQNVLSGGEGVSYDFPILDNPTSVLFPLLLNQGNADLFTFHAELNAHFLEQLQLPFSIFGLSLGLQTSGDFNFNVTAGYDTQGITDMISDHFTNLGADFAKGFYVSTGTQQDPIVSLDAEFSAQASGSFGPVSFGVTGGVYTDDGNNTATWDSPTPLTITLTGGSGGKVRLINNTTPPSFQFEGAIYAGLYIWVKAGYYVFNNFVGVEKDFNIAQVELFGPNSSAPTLASENMGVLTLKNNLGPNETFVVSPDPDGKGGDVDVNFQGYTEEFTGVQQIDATTPTSGKNSITIESGVDANATLISGGAGSDYLTYDGAGNATLIAGSGDDQLMFDGSAGNGTLLGGSGTDILIGATGDDSLTGGSGTNELTAGTGDDSLTGGSGTNELTAGTGPCQMNGGSGTNVYNWQTGDGAITVNGMGYFNTLNVTAAESSDIFAVSASGSALSITVKSKSGTDLGTIPALDIQTLDMDDFGGYGTYTVNDLNGTGINNVYVNLHEIGTPDGTADSVTENVVSVPPTFERDGPTGPATVTVGTTYDDSGEHQKIGPLQLDLYGQVTTTKVAQGNSDYVITAAVPDTTDQLTLNTHGGPPGGPRGLLPWGSHGSVRALSGIRLFIS